MKETLRVLLERFLCVSAKTTQGQARAAQLLAHAIQT
jgi:hypothetical protein